MLHLSGCEEETPASLSSGFPASDPSVRTTLSLRLSIYPSVQALYSVNLLLGLMSVMNEILRPRAPAACGKPVGLVTANRAVPCQMPGHRLTSCATVPRKPVDADYSELTVLSDDTPVGDLQTFSSPTIITGPGQRQYQACHASLAKFDLQPLSNEDHRRSKTC